MKCITTRLPSRQALRVIRKVRRLHGLDPGAILLEEAEESLICGNARGAIAALEKFELVAAIGSEERGLVQIAHGHLHEGNIQLKVVLLLIKLAISPLHNILVSIIKWLRNSISVKWPACHNLPTQQV